MAADSPHPFTQQREVSLIEHIPVRLPATMLTEADAAYLWERHTAQLHVEFPSRKTLMQWELTNLGWVGTIPLPQSATLRLLPSTSIADLFGMLAYAYQLNSLHILAGVVATKPVEYAYEHLAGILARLIIARCRQGIYRGYVTRHERLDAARGRIDLRQSQRPVIDPKLQCSYQDQTADVPENHYLVLTLAAIVRSHLCTERTLPMVRQAYRLLRQQVTVVSAATWTEPVWNYHRLNADYRPLHALCRFFLDQQGPGYAAGPQASLPFLLALPRLFERFVAEWCLLHCPPTLTLHRQQPLIFAGERDIRFIADLVVYQRATGVPLAVVDTKYRTHANPSTADIAQVVAYAEAIGCRHALLVYPTPLAVPLAITIGDVHVHSVTFDLAKDIAIAGAALLQQWAAIGLL